MEEAPGLGPFQRALNGAIDGFKHQDHYFKLQAAILGGWVLVSILTLVVLLLSGRSQNKLGAEVRAEAAVGGSIVLVTNTSTDAWTDITFTLNGLYVWRKAELDPGDHLAVPVKRFRKGGVAGKHAPRTLIPQTLNIRCEEGQFDTGLTVVAGGLAP